MTPSRHELTDLLERATADLPLHPDADLTRRVVAGARSHRRRRALAAATVATVVLAGAVGVTAQLRTSPARLTAGPATPAPAGPGLVPTDGPPGRLVAGTAPAASPPARGTGGGGVLPDGTAWFVDAQQLRVAGADGTWDSWPMPGALPTNEHLYRAALLTSTSAALLVAPQDAGDRGEFSGKATLARTFDSGRHWYLQDLSTTVTPDADQELIVDGPTLLGVNTGSETPAPDLGFTALVPGAAELRVLPAPSQHVTAAAGLLWATYGSPSDSTVYRSSDDGRTWVTVAQGSALGHGVALPYGNGILFEPWQEGGDIYAAKTLVLGDADGLHPLAHVDAGAYPLVPDASAVVGLTPTDPSTLVSVDPTTGEVTRTATTGLPAPGTELVLLGLQGRTGLAAGCADTACATSQTYVSSDSGRTWNPVNDAANSRK